MNVKKFTDQTYLSTSYHELDFLNDFGNKFVTLIAFLKKKFEYVVHFPVIIINFPFSF